MISRMRLLLTVVFIYAAVLNIFVTQLYFQRRRQSQPRHAAFIAGGGHTQQAPQLPLPYRIASTAGDRAVETYGVASAEDEDALDHTQTASCPVSVPAIVVVVHSTQDISRPERPDLRIFETLRGMLRGYRVRVEIVGPPDRLTEAHRLWCRSAPVPCGIHAVPVPDRSPGKAPGKAPGDAHDLGTLGSTLLAIRPCLDDMVVLASSLALHDLFLRQLQRLTFPGKLACLAAPRPQTKSHAPASLGAASQFSPCPALAYRVPRAFLWQTREHAGQPAALAAERGLLAPTVPLLYT